MKTRCPCCGATTSLDALLAHDDARDALRALVALGGELGKGAVIYAGMHRPGKSELSWGRLSKILNELAEAMAAGEIERNGQRYPAPQAAWLWAFAEMRKRRDAGSLVLPLKGHGYLYEVLSRWDGQGATATVMPAATSQVMATGKVASKTLGGVAALEGMKR
ncbi:hypothetical protein [Cardiobacterium hominis]|uniref:hypothetical protein n=1 Tax=Cardiobacterium hominis TaxID=2718 RepID=UPI0028D03F8D|nr:hypothetical protein [Cardiobacterium hominis]